MMLFLVLLADCIAVPAAPTLSNSLAEVMRPLLEPLGQLLYDLLRPVFVQLADMDTLAELIDILQHEVGVGQHCSTVLYSTLMQLHMHSQTLLIHWRTSYSLYVEDRQEGHLALHVMV